MVFQHACRYNDRNNSYKYDVFNKIYIKCTHFGYRTLVILLFYLSHI